MAPQKAEETKQGPTKRAFPSRLSHHGDGCLTHPEDRRIGILYANTNGKSRRKVHPIQRAFDIGQAIRYGSVFWKDAKANALHDTFEPVVRMTHQVDIDMHPGTDVLELGFPIVGDDPPVTRVDQGKERAAGASIGSFGDIHVGHVSVEWCHHAATLEIEPGAENFGGFGLTL